MPTPSEDFLEQYMRELGEQRRRDQTVPDSYIHLTVPESFIETPTREATRERIRVPAQHCCYCETVSVARMPNGVAVCETHRERHFRQCQRCERWDGRYEFNTISGTPPIVVCMGCIRHCPQCTICTRYYNNADGAPQCCDPNALRCLYCRSEVRIQESLSDEINPATDLAVSLPGPQSNSRLACQYCFEINWSDCDQCGDPHERGRMAYINNGGDTRVCTDCVSSMDLPRCGYCDSNFYPGSPCHTQHDNENPDGCECNSCDEMESEGIHSYSFKPSPKFQGNGPVFLGWELEVESEGSYYDSDRMNSLVRVTKRGVGTSAYLKSDSSIEYGFELVTHPMSYDWAMAEFSWNTFAKMVKTGAHAGDSCGLHVHVSKDGFTNASHDYRWLMFWHRNHRMITKIARRDSTQWAAFRPQDRNNAIKVAKKQQTGDMERYQAINPQNSATYEVRVFASSLEVQEVQAALALVDSTVEYTRTLKSSDVLKDDGWSWGAYRQWLNKRPKYQPLINELNKITLKRKGRA